MIYSYQHSSQSSDVIAPSLSPVAINEAPRFINDGVDNTADTSVTADNKESSLAIAPPPKPEPKLVIRGDRDRQKIEPK